jgi:hypothetical protein
MATPSAEANRRVEWRIACRPADVCGVVRTRPDIQTRDKLTTLNAGCEGQLEDS